MCVLSIFTKDIYYHYYSVLVLIIIIVIIIIIIDIINVAFPTRVQLCAW